MTDKDPVGDKPGLTGSPTVNLGVFTLSSSNSLKQQFHWGLRHPSETCWPLLFMTNRKFSSFLEDKFIWGRSEVRLLFESLVIGLDFFFVIIFTSTKSRNFHRIPLWYNKRFLSSGKQTIYSHNWIYNELYKWYWLLCQQKMKQKLIIDDIT